MTLDEAERQLAGVGVEAQEVVADKGYHSNQTMTGIRDRGLRSYVSEPDRGRRSWKRNRDAQKPTYANRRRIRGRRGKRLLRQRGEKVERGFAHMLGSGGLRRVHLRDQEEIRKRILIRAAAFNLGLLMRTRFGFGTPRSLQGTANARRPPLPRCLLPDSPVLPPHQPLKPDYGPFRPTTQVRRISTMLIQLAPPPTLQKPIFSTDC